MKGSGQRNFYKCHELDLRFCQCNERLPVRRSEYRIIRANQATNCANECPLPVHLCTADSRAMGGGAASPRSLHTEIRVRWEQAGGLHAGRLPHADQCLRHHRDLLPAGGVSQPLGLQETHRTRDGRGHHLVKGAGNQDARVARC